MKDHTIKTTLQKGLTQEHVKQAVKLLHKV